jgi:thiamine-monophosphate kinase
MLVQGRHFFADVDPCKLGHKALAVNLSDLAACGARPLAFTLALSLPSVDEPWLAAFAQGLFALADAHTCELIGGDTTAGPLNICITVFGEVPVVAGISQALLRSGAQPGDDIYVSGTLGDARLALDALQGKLVVSDSVLKHARARLEMPTPRVALGLALRGLATAAIDVSDGLLGDLGHILKSSGVGATIEVDDVINTIASYAYTKDPIAPFDIKLSVQQWRAFALAGGDDYELLFTAKSEQRVAVANAALATHTPVTRIGQIEIKPGLRLVDRYGQGLPNQYTSFDHFGMLPIDR